MLTVVGTRFTSVTTTADGDETTNLTFLQQKCHSLYESQLIASIFDDEDSGDDLLKNEDCVKSDLAAGKCGIKQKERNVLSDLNEAGDLLAVAVGEDISIFSFDCGTRFVITVHLGGDVDPVAMKFMPSVNLLAIVTNSCDLMFLNIGSNSIIDRLKLMTDKTLKRASIICECQHEGMQMCIVLDTGEIFSFMFANYSEYFHSEQDKEMEISNRRKGISAMTWKSLGKYCNSADIAIICELGVLFLVPSVQGIRPAVIDLSSETPGALDEFDLSDYTGFVRLRYVSCRDQHTSEITVHYIMALTTDGCLFVWDPTTTVLLSTTNLLQPGEIAKDFMLVDFVPEKEGSIGENSKLVLLFKNENDVYQIQIRKLQTCDIIYTKVVSSSTHLLDKVTREDGLILFIQLTAESSELNCVNIHAVYECQPEMRLEHLLYRQRWAEAEQFAQAFNLTMEIIYKARIEHFVDIGMMALADVETFELDNFIGWMRKVSDENWVAEMCIAAIMYCSSHLWVKKIFEFARTLKVTDDETNEKLALLRYNYQSYCEVLGPRQKLCSNISSGINLWPEFLGGCSWERIFEYFYKNGQFGEARLLWCRYRQTLVDWIREKGNFEHVLTDIRIFIRDTNCDIMDAIQLLEHEVIPAAIVNDPVTCCTCCTSFLMDLARSMETEYPENFPENSLQIASTMERVVDSLLRSFSTPSVMAEIAHALSVIGCYSEDPVDLMGDLNVYVRNLRGLERLKNVYQCTMSYNTYQEQTVESICYLILERVRSVQLIKNNIEQYARPYMNEFKLDPDRTLYSYILKIANSSVGVVSSANPWDERCLVVAESISNVGLRCEAFIGIAKRAYPPWTKQLSSAINAMLNDPTIDVKMASRLQEQCDFAALGEMMIRYRIPIHLLERYLEQKHIFAKGIDFIFRQECVEIDPQRRLADALQIIELAKKLRKNLMESYECVFRFCLYLINSKGRNNSVFELRIVELAQCLSNLNEMDRNHVIDQLVSHVEALLNCSVILPAEKEMELRTQNVEAVLSVLERFRKDEMLQAELKALRKLQNNYDTLVQLSFLNNDAWKSTKLRDFIKCSFADNNVLPKMFEIRKISNALMLKRNLMYEIALDCALETRSPVAALEYAKFAMQDSERRSEQLLKFVLQSCGYALWIMSDLAEKNDFEPIFAMFGSMSDFISKFVEATCENSSLGNHVFHIALFVKLFEAIVSQCMCEDLLGNEDESMKKCFIYGMRRRVGVYQYKMDGNLYNKSDVIQQLAIVARPVVIDVLNSTDLIDIDSGNLLGYYEAMRTAWKDFYSYLLMNNQILIAICARLSFALLSCYVIPKHVITVYSELHGALELFMERALAHRYADLELCAALIFSVPVSDIKKILLKTRSWTVTRKSPQVTLNFIRLARFCTIVFGDFSINKQLNQYYALSLWMKKLGKLGANFPQHVVLETTVDEFVRCHVPPEILIEFCKDFSLEVDEALVLFATKMAIKSSSEKDLIIAAEMRFAVSTALQELHVTENLFMRLYACLMALCPYSYETIEVIIGGMERYVDEDISDQETILRRASIIIRFLEVNDRTSSPTDHEIRWYQERQKFLNKQGGSNYDTTVRVVDGEELISVEEESSGSLYKKATLLTDQLPKLAQHRLPFHPFMFENDKDIKNTLLPMIHAERTLHNVENWQIFVRAVPELEISKSDLLSSAILVAVQTCINKGTEMDECDIALIMQLLRKASNPLRVLQGLTDGFKHLPLCKTKLRFLSVGVDIIKEWLAKSEQGAAEREDVCFLKQFLRNLEEAHKSYSIEYVLKKYRILRMETLDLMSTPEDLIEHIYANEIDWNNPKDINDKVPCAMELARIFDLDLNTIQDKIMQQWLDWDAQMAVPFDPNETSSSDTALIPMLKPENNESNEEFYRLPFVDPTVSRIVQLAQLRGSEKAASALADICRQSPTMVSHESKIRSACCLLRLLRSEQFPAVVKCDLNKFCSRLELMLYSRMIDVYKIDLTIERFMSTEKTILLKSLVNNCRQTPQLALFMSSVMIDFQLIEPFMVDMLLTKLCLERKYEMLVDLLKYCTTNKNLSWIKNIEMKWSHAAQWMLLCVEKGSDNEKQQFHRFLMFCLSCPVEYGSAIAILLHSVERDKYPVAHRLLMLASSSIVAEETAEDMKEYLEGTTRSKLDFPLKWQ